MSQTIAEGMAEVQEIILGVGSHPMTIAANTLQQLDQVAHNLNTTPFIDYKISHDGGVTFYDPTQFPDIDSSIYCDAFCDNNNIYFSYHYTVSPATNSAFSLVFKFKLSVTETSNR